MLFIILPVILSLLSFAIWWAIISHTRNANSVKNSLNTKVASTIVILLFFVHPNIVKFYRAFKDHTKNIVYIVMELADGGNLE
jgi:serine/threonine protein kinase